MFWEFTKGQELCSVWYRAGWHTHWLIEVTVVAVVAAIIIIIITDINYYFCWHLFCVSSFTRYNTKWFRFFLLILTTTLWRMCASPILQVKKAEVQKVRVAFQGHDEPIRVEIRQGVLAPLLLFPRGWLFLPCALASGWKHRGKAGDALRTAQSSIALAPA